VRDGRKEATDLGSVQSGIFLHVRLDDPNRLEPFDEIAFYAQANLGGLSRVDRARATPSASEECWTVYAAVTIMESPLERA
jgi:hypothetical protein